MSKKPKQELSELSQEIVWRITRKITGITLTEGEAEAIKKWVDECTHAGSVRSEGSVVFNE
jgi:hypothetical protein